MKFETVKNYIKNANSAHLNKFFNLDVKNDVEKINILDEMVNNGEEQTFSLVVELKHVDGQQPLSIICRKDLTKDQLRSVAERIQENK